ncbi:MAG: dihydroorotate dehydrogenase electron transfer subunit [Gammaproteobacteria bacterium]|nr:dihydroorotate dehydrogenase electron transfer subunit [Gammaproteobacteria bacterium]MDH3749017.1 dihydroorotate dehydrogenase electron transfer subunit [Gammaproteobacteria bacterium]
MTTAAQKHAQRNRGTLFVEDGELVATEVYPGDQFIMRIRAPKCAAAARPGSFVHVNCDDTLPMRRPLSIMRSIDDCIEVLYKVVGEGLHLLAGKRPGDMISVLGPIGQPFVASPERPNCLLIGGGVGIPPMVFLAETLRDERWNPLAILGSEIPFPFEPETSDILTPWLDEAVSSAMPLLESWRIPSRLASFAGFSGCFRGYVTELAARWLQSLDDAGRAKTEIFACGPTPMLKAVAALAAEQNLPCQVSLEEFMACGVGGCAGCTVQVTTQDGPAMQRVCVDGPVFDAASVVWQ